MNKRNKWVVLLTAGLMAMLTNTACTQNKNNTDATETEQTEVTQEEMEALAKVLPKYNSVESFSEGLAVVCNKKTGLYGFIDKMGNEVIPCKYYFVRQGFHDGVAIVYPEEEREVVIDREGNELFQIEEVYQGSGFCDGLMALLKVNETNDDDIDWMHFAKVGYIDTNGNMAIPFKYDVMMGEGPIVYEFSEGLCRQYDPENNKSFFINKTGKVVFECKGSADDFSEGMAAVGKDISDNEDEYMWRIGFVDKTGFEAIPFTFQHAGKFKEDLCWAESDSFCGFINKNGKFEITGDWKTLILYEDTEGETPLNPQFSEGLAWVCNKDGKFGYIDKTGKTVVPFRYEPGYEEGGEWYCDQPCYDFHEGIARVWDKKTEKYGFIDREGNEVQPCHFDSAEDMSEGLALVMLGDKFGFINKEGKCTLDMAK